MEEKAFNNLLRSVKDLGKLRLGDSAAARPCRIAFSFCLDA